MRVFMSPRSQEDFQNGTDREFGYYPPLIIFEYYLGWDSWGLTLHGFDQGGHNACALICTFLGMQPDDRTRTVLRPDGGLYVQYVPPGYPLVLPLKKIVFCRRFRSHTCSFVLSSGPASLSSVFDEPINPNSYHLQCRLSFLGFPFSLSAGRIRILD